MNGNHHDPAPQEPDETQLTAYAMGQLGRQERAAVEAKLARSEKARQLVEETTTLAGHVLQAHRQSPSVQPSAALREAVENHLNQLGDSPMKATHDPSHATKAGRRRFRWVALALAACLLVAAIPLLLPNIRSARETARRPPSSGDRPIRLHLQEGMEDVGTAPSGESEPQPGTAWEIDLTGSPSPAADPLAGLPGSTEQPSTGAYDLRGIMVQGSQTEFGRISRNLEEGRSYQPVATGPAGRTLDHQPANGSVHSLDGGKPVTLNAGTLTPGQPGTGNGKGFFVTGQPTTLATLADPAAQIPQATIAKAVEAHAEAQQVRDVILAKRIRLQEIQTRSGRGVEDPAYQRLHEEVARNEATLEQIRRRLQLGLAPNSAAPGTEQYDAIIENEFIEAIGEQAVSTFSVDVDTASYANVRRFLSHGRWPPPDAVRIEEMVNYFAYGYPPPEGDVPFSVHMEVAGCPWNGDHRLLRVGLKGREIDSGKRGPGHLVFLLDVSGSMRDDNKLPLVKQAMTMLVDQLGEDDRVAIVTYASGTELKLESTGGHQHETLRAAIDSLSAGGSTHGSAGIQLAYQQAVEHFVSEGTNRVILCTDGDLNVGITDDDELVKLIREKAQSGVFLTVLGFGTGNLKDSKLEKLADQGNGTYAYIDGLREADKVLVEQLSGNLVTIAKDVKLQLIFNPAEVQSYRLVGYENRMLAAPDFDDDEKDAGEIGAGHTVTALYELVPADRDRPTVAKGVDLKYQRVAKHLLTKEAGSGELLTLRLRYKQPDGTRSERLEFVVKDEGKRFGRASADFRFASAVASFGMVLRGSAHGGELTLSAVEEFAAGALGDDPGGYRKEFLDLVRSAKQLPSR